jgi:hypothetical protein
MSGQVKYVPGIEEKEKRKKGRWMYRLKKMKGENEGEVRMNGSKTHRRLINFGRTNQSQPH